jgi:uracil-DNA glycosylase
MSDSSIPATWYDLDCRECPRLSTFLDDVKTRYPDYFCRPVPPFGDRNARLLIIGLAPGMHGANATGRPFTGDHAGILLYQTLHKYGFASADESLSANDDLRLIDCRISNAVKCLPPQNKPVGDEVNQCKKYLLNEIADMPQNSVLLMLGSIAHTAMLKCLGLKASKYPFSHGAYYQLDSGQQLLSSYHCSRYNTQTKRLTAPMFESIFSTARQLMDRAE